MIHCTKAQSNYKEDKTDQFIHLAVVAFYRFVDQISAPEFLETSSSPCWNPTHTSTNSAVITRKRCRRWRIEVRPIVLPRPTCSWRYSRPRHAPHFVALACSWWRHNGTHYYSHQINNIHCTPTPQLYRAHAFASISDRGLWPWLSVPGELSSSWLMILGRRSVGWKDRRIQADGHNRLH